jgi:myo-inositol 2-dehydrogenase/D-chiro-inositol 1-dehydrogenase
MSMAPAVAVGIVGAGWIGRQHVEALANRSDVKVAGVCDLRHERAASAAALVGARTFGGWEEMLEEADLDAVWVCTPPTLHASPALAAIERGLGLYLEKPIARSLAEGRAIGAAAEAQGAICAVGYQWHALDLLDDIHLALAGQAVGCVLGQSLGPTAKRPWFIDQAQGGGNLLERGSHHIDLIRAVAGEVVAVQCRGGTVSLSPRSAGEGDIADTVTMVLQLANGGLATIVVAWARDGLPGTYRLQVVASEALLDLELDPSFRLSGASRGRPLEAVARLHPFERSIDCFLGAVKRGDRHAVACPPADALRTLTVALAAEEALSSGQTVAVRG